MPFNCRGAESPGGPISGLPAHAYDMYIMPPSPTTPVMHSQPGQQQRQQQLQQSTPPYRMRHDQLNSPGMHTPHVYVCLASHNADLTTGNLQTA